MPFEVDKNIKRLYSYWMHNNASFALNNIDYISNLEKEKDLLEWMLWDEQSDLQKEILNKDIAIKSLQTQTNQLLDSKKTLIEKLKGCFKF
jgi:hypothetical protein